MKTKLRIDFNEIINLIENRRQNAYKKINEELILLYWDFGKYISNKIIKDKWGTKVVDSLVRFIKEKYPTLKGFNRAGIYRMKQFYEVYKDYPEIVSTLLRQLNWSSHIQILSGTKTIEERKFYMELAIKEKYTARELARQINTSYYQRYMISNKNISNNKTVLIHEQEIPNTRFLDTYSLDFINLPEDYKEIDLRKAIISNLKKFILEIGKSFTFIGEEYRIQVGNEDFYIDLLFYNRELSCLVAFELKIGKFIPEYISKMNFYLEALDRQEKKLHENPSIGIILCTTKDEEVVEYTMSRSLSPTMVADYKLNLIDKKVLEDKLKEITQVVEENMLNQEN